MYSYNIHGLVSIQSTVPLSLPSYFLVDGLEGKPDVAVKVGDVNYNSDDKYRVGAKYFWDPEDHRIIVDWSKDAVKWSNIRAAVTDLQSNTTIETTSTFHRFGDFDKLINSVIRFRLLQQNTVIIHAAGLQSPQGSGFLIQGLSNMGKSSTSLPLAVNRGYGFLGDDSVIIHKNNVYCYP